MKKHYDNLGLPITASRADVKRSYRKLAMQLHPDKNPHPKAAGLFNELQDSYNILMDHLDPTKPKAPVEKSQIRRDKSNEERVNEAKKRFYEQKQRENRANERYFDKLTKGKKWQVYKTGSIICAIAAFFLLIDLILPGFTEKDKFTGWSHSETGGIAMNFVHPVVLENNGTFYIEKGLFNDIHMHPTTYIVKSRVLHLPLEIVHPVIDELKIYKLDWCFSALLPYVILLFVFPLLLFFYRKKSPDFVFSYLLSLYVIFPITAVFLIMDNRWLHLLTLGFL